MKNPRKIQKRASCIVRRERSSLDEVSELLEDAVCDGLKVQRVYVQPGRPGRRQALAHLNAKFNTKLPHSLLVVLNAAIECNHGIWHYPTLTASSRATSDSGTRLLHISVMRWKPWYVLQYVSAMMLTTDHQVANLEQHDTGYDDCVDTARLAVLNKLLVQLGLEEHLRRDQAGTGVDF